MRQRFLATADTARPLLDLPDLEERWDAPSALDGMSVGALCAHLARAVTVVPGYLDTPAEPPFVDAAGYFLALFPRADPDPDSEMGVSVRSRAAGVGTQGSRHRIRVPTAHGSASGTVTL